MTDQDDGIIADGTLISRTTSVLTAEIRDEVVMMDVDSGRYLGLDDIGGDIWRRLEQPSTFAQLLQGLLADYDAEPAVVARDLSALLLSMAQHRLVTLSSPASA